MIYVAGKKYNRSAAGSEYLGCFVLVVYAKTKNTNK